MGTFAGSDLINTVARRLRDTGNIGYTRVQVLDIINRTQRSINAYLGLVMNNTTFVTTVAPLYSVSAIAADIVRIIEVREGSRILTKIPWQHLQHQSPKWVRMPDGQPEVFATIGRDLLALVPVPKTPTTLTVTYVKLTTNMTDSGVSFMDLPDEHKPLLVDLAEAVLLFRGREFKIMQAALKRIADALGIEVATQGMRRLSDATHE